jgi:hypothetical protein
MKTLILSIAIVFSTLSSFAQTAITPFEKTKIEEFILDRSFEMNKSQTPVLVEDVTVLIKKIKSTGVNVSYHSFVFFGNQVDSNFLTGGDASSTGGGKVKPFIYYSIKQVNGETVLEVVSGNSFL